jgi:hypothetical protein
LISDEVKRIYIEIEEMIRANPHLLDLADTKKCPSSVKSRTVRYASFSNAYLAELFQEEVVLMLPLYLRLVFGNYNAETLCTKFKFRCCQSEHSNACNKLWKKFESWLKNDMVKEVLGSLFSRRLRCLHWTLIFWIRRILDYGTVNSAGIVRLCLV